MRSVQFTLRLNRIKPFRYQPSSLVATGDVCNRSKPLPVVRGCAHQGSGSRPWHMRLRAPCRCTVLRDGPQVLTEKYSQRATLSGAAIACTPSSRGGEAQVAARIVVFDAQKKKQTHPWRGATMFTWPCVVVVFRFVLSRSEKRKPRWKCVLSWTRRVSEQFRCVVPLSPISTRT